jgi:hypothetical protein
MRWLYFVWFIWLIFAIYLSIVLFFMSIAISQKQVQICRYYYPEFLDKLFFQAINPKNLANLSQISVWICENYTKNITPFCKENPGLCFSQSGYLR